jgi:hypothetical protein
MLISLFNSVTLLANFSVKELLQREVYLRKTLLVLLLVIAASCVFPIKSFAQGDQLNPPNEIPPSGQTQQFEKYGNFPPGAYNGIPEISIPLYTITDGDLTVPITLNYYADGFKPSSPSGIVGMNWTLMTGGKISRTIVDMPDDITSPPPNFYTSAQLENMALYTRDTVLDYWRPGDGGLDTKDTEPDIFSYNFNGHAGKFVVKRDGAYTPVLFPYKPISIQPIYIGYLKGFNATDENGIKYQFIEDANTEGTQYNAVTDWDEVYIRSPKGNQINFSWGTVTTEAGYSMTNSFGIYDSYNTASGLNCDAPTDPAYTGDPMSQYLDPYYNPGEVDDVTSPVTVAPVPTQIQFSGGKVSFIYQTGGANEKRLQQIQIADTTGKVLRNINFVYSTSDIEDTFLLTEVDFYDGQNVLINNYKMSYNSYNPAFGTTNITTGNGASTDYWGYYNGGIPAGGNLIPNWQIQQNPASYPALTPSSGTNKTSSLNYTETYILDTLKYPTGGYTTYQYELNQISSTQQVYPFNTMGGLRIKTIEDFDSPGAIPQMRTYTYGTGNVDYLPGTVSDYSYSYQGILPDDATEGLIWPGPWLGFRERWYTSDPVYNQNPHGAPVIYQQVSEYMGNGTTNSGRTDYLFDYQAAPNVITPQIALPYDLEGNTVIFKEYLLPDFDWATGNLLSKTDFKNVNGNYQMVEEDDYNYTDYPSTNTIRGMKIARYVNYASNCSVPSYINTAQLMNLWGDAFSAMYFGSEVYNFADYTIAPTDRRLTSKTISKYYLSTGAIPSPSYTQHTDYVYSDTVRDQPTRETINSSTGDSYITQLKYPIDFAGSNTTYFSMDTAHIWSMPVEKLNYKDTLTNFLSSVQTSYDANGRVLSVATKKSNYSNPYDTRLQYNAYHIDKPTDINKPSGPHTSYIWGYGNRYPIAECINAPVNDIFFDGFEEGDGTSTSGDAKTGNYSSLNGYSKTLTGLDNGSYILSYWQKQSSTWVLQTTTVAVTGNTATISLSGQVDDVRFYPVNAQMTTYTYNLLVGMTSSTDAKEKITYYEYDNFQRLINIKDQYGNIVKHIDYHYQGH